MTNCSCGGACGRRRRTPATTLHPISIAQGPIDQRKDNMMTAIKSDACPHCGAKPGELHELGCGVEGCPQCGGQLLSCGHSLPGDAQSPPERAS